jgi:hypothetical protein
MSDIIARVGQQNTIKLISSISGGNAYSDASGVSVNVIGGIASVSQLNVSGVSTFVGVATFRNDVYIDGNLRLLGDLYFDEFSARNGNVTGILTIGQPLYYPQGNPYGIAYFDNNDQLVSTASTLSAINTTNYVLTTNSSGIPSWSNTIDGGEY